MPVATCLQANEILVASHPASMVGWATAARLSRPPGAAVGAAVGGSSLSRFMFRNAKLGLLPGAAVTVTVVADTVVVEYQKSTVSVDSKKRVSVYVTVSVVDTVVVLGTVAVVVTDRTVCGGVYLRYDVQYSPPTALREAMSSEEGSSPGTLKH